MTRGRAAAWALLGLVGLVALGPAVLAPASRLAGSDWLDAFGTQWFFWWTGRALSEGGGLAHTDLLFYPWGKDVLRHTGLNLLDAVLALPLRLLLGPVAGMNAWSASILAGNAFGAERLAKAAGAGPWGRWTAAALGLVAPCALVELELGRPTQAMLLFPALWLASLVEPPSWRAALLGGLWLALSGLGYWFHGLLGGLAGAVALAVRLLVGPRRLAETARVLGAGALALALVSPLLWPLLGQAATMPGLLALQPTPGPLGHLGLVTEQGDPQALFVVAANGLGGTLLDAEGLRFAPGLRQILLTHLVAVVAAAALALRRSALPLAWVAVLGLVALGPLVVAGDRFVANPLLIAAYEHLDLLRRWWWPGRAAALATLAVALLAALVVDRLGARRGPVLALLLLAGAVAETAWDGSFPLSAWDARVSPGLRCLRDAPASAVLELPYALGQRPLYHQTVHGKPMLNGMLVSKDAFVPPEAVALRTGNSFVRLLVRLGDRQYRSSLDVDPADRQAFLDLGYRYVLVRKEGFVRPVPGSPGAMESDWDRGRRHFRDAVGWPAWEDDELAIYVLTGEPFACAP